MDQTKSSRLRTLKALKIVLFQTLVVLVGVGTVPVLHSQQPTFVSGTALVRIEVSVFDEHGTVRGLSAKDFDVIDSGRSPEFVVQEVSSLPLDLDVVIQPFRSLSGVQPALFAGAFQAVLNSLLPADRLGVVLAALPPIQIRPLGEVVHDIGQATLAGTFEPSLFDAIAGGLLEFPPSDRRKVLLVIADGVDRRSVLGSDVVARMATHVKPEIVLLGSASSLLDSIRFHAADEQSRAGSRREEQALEFRNRFPTPALHALASSSGGQVVDLMSKDPRNVVTALFDTLRSGYLLSYKGSEVKGWHPVSIRVKRPNVTVATRPGYYVS